MRRFLFSIGCASASAFSLNGLPVDVARAAASPLPPPPLHASAALRASRSSSHGPRMNMGERFVRLVKSNVNDMMNKMEDPEKVLEQAVADMQKDLVKVRQAYAEVSASTKRMEEQIKLAEAEGAKWYERAQLALSKGEEELAREALTRRKQQLEMADSLREQVRVPCVRWVVWMRAVACVRQRWPGLTIPMLAGGGRWTGSRRRSRRCTRA